MYIRGIYDGSCLLLGSLGPRHDLPLHAAIHGHDLAAVITDVKALRTEDCGKLTKKGLHEGWGWMGMVSSPIYLSFVTFPDIYMGIVQKVLDLSVVFDDLWYAKMTFGES